MKLMGFEVTRAKEGYPVPTASWWGLIRESFAGHWQTNIPPLTTQALTAFSAVYACIALIADDISKLAMKLMEQGKDGVWDDITRASPLAAVLRRPNAYQNRIQFLSYWICSKLIYGNAYILLERTKGVVTSLYCLDPRLVTPLVTEEGSVYYRLNVDTLSGVTIPIVVRDTDIIHDRCVTLFHPLVGVPPIYACAASATQGIKIQQNSATFFENMSRPSGQLTAPGPISKETAERLKTAFEENYSGGRLGRLLVAGDGLKYEPMSMPADQSQLIEQLGWTVEDVARCFKVPLYKLSGVIPAAANTGILNQDYYTQTLQAHIECIELLLLERLGLDSPRPKPLGVELDIASLLRMDPLAQVMANKEGIAAGYIMPDEARLSQNLHPVPGGNTPYMQQQNYSLSALAARDAAGPAPSAGPAPALPAPPKKEKNSDVEKFISELRLQFEVQNA